MPAPSNRKRSARSKLDHDVGVVIVNYRTPELTMRCLAALSKERGELPLLRVLIVDGGSGDASAEALTAALAHPSYSDWVDFLPLSINGGFGWANNQAILSLASKKELPEFIHLLNPDAEVCPGAVLRLVDFLDSHPSVAAVGSQLLHPDGSFAGSAFSFPSIRGEFSRGAGTGLLERLLKVPPISFDPSEAMQVDWVTGASVLLRVKALRGVGLFDEGFFLYNDEVELMWRLRRAGWAIATEPRSQVHHIGGAATGVSDRTSGCQVEPRRPAFLFRSRARFFGLTRGWAVAFAAYAAWLAGHVIWCMRWLLGAPNGNRIDHLMLDHLRYAFPRKHDCTAAVATLESDREQPPAWMRRRWL